MALGRRRGAPRIGDLLEYFDPPDLARQMERHKRALEAGAVAPFDDSDPARPAGLRLLSPPGGWLAGLIADAMRLLTVLRAALKEHYGITSEKLAEFGMQPFRGRSRKAALVVPPPEVKPAAFPAATPTESPDSES